MDVVYSPCDHVVLSHKQVSSLPSSLYLTDPQVIFLNVFTSLLSLCVHTQHLSVRQMYQETEILHAALINLISFNGKLLEGGFFVPK
jgi:hypothetical protein